MKYTTVFEITGGLAFPWSDLIFLAVIAVGILFGFGLYKTHAKLFSYIIPIIIIGVGLLCLIGYIIGYFDLRNDVIDEYDKGQYQIAQGEVEQFHPMPPEEHDTEHFYVNGVYFEYPDFTGVSYSLCKKDGGFITGDGEKVRIQYIYYSGLYSGGGENIILKLEVADK